MQVNIDSSNHSTINTEKSVLKQTNTTEWTFERYGSIMDWIMSYDQASIPFMSNKVSAVRNNLTCRQYMQWLHNGSTIIYENADLHKPVEERTIKEVYYNDYIHDMSNAYTKCDRVLLLHRATSSGVRFITLDCDDSSIVDEYPDEDQRFRKAVSMMPDELRKIAFFTKSRNKKLPHAHIQVFNQLQYECIYSIINCLTFWNNNGDILMAGSWEANARTTDMFVCSDNELGLERHMELREFNCTYDRKPRVTYTSSMSYGIIPDIDFTTLLKWTNDKGKQFIEKTKERNSHIKKSHKKDCEKINEEDANELFSIFKRSKYYVASAGFEIFTVDTTNNWIIIKAHNPYYCNICNREHINNSNRSVIYQTKNIVGYLCRTGTVSKVLVYLNSSTIHFRDDDENRGRINEIENNFNNMVVEFEKSHFKILRRGMYGYIDPDTGIVEVKTRENIVNMWRHLSIGKMSSGTSVLFIHKWLDGYDKIRMYQDINVYPYPRICPENHYNLWGDFEIERRIPRRTIETMDMNIVNRFREYLLVLVNGVKEHRDWLEKWIAHAIQRPGEKVGKCIIFIGNEGSGKTTIVNILRRMMGNDRVRTYVKPDRDLFGDFNSGLDKCYIVNLNETHSSQTSGESYESFKALITDDTVDINTKGKDVMTVLSYHRIIVTTNKSTPITQADNNDRRFVVFRTSDKLCGEEMKKTFWVSFRNDIVNNDESIRTLYDWYKYDWSDENKWNISTFASEPSPVTYYQKELRKFSEKPIDSFLIDTANNDENYRKIEDEDITLQVLYDMFRNWAKEKELRHIPSNKKFSADLLCLNINGTGEKIHKRKGAIFVGWNWKKIRDHYGVSFIDDDSA